MGDERKIVVVVEDVEASRTALLWCLHHLLRHGDVLTLLHVYNWNSSSSSVASNKRRISKKKLRSNRLRGFQLALSFKEICNTFPNAKIEIVVTEGEEQGAAIVRLVREIGASTLVVGLHDHSFLYRLSMAHNNITSNFNCKVVAISQPLNTPTSSKRTSPKRRVLPSAVQSSTNMDFSHIEISSGLRLPDIPSPKIPYRICPNPSAIIWRSRKTRRKSETHSP